ncbi:MAG: hypothetical protein M1836_007299 [Candelina mexicana]|nr:MAG: hypothetical protein M1836_007299 [Candelina mexicana]
MAKNVPYCQFCDYGMNRNPQEYKFLGSDADPPSTITRWESPPMFPRGSGCVVRGWSRGAAEMPPQVSETELRLREAEKNMAANRRLSVYLDGHQHEPAENVTESIGPHITIVEKGPKPPGKGGEGDEGPSSRPGRLWAKVKEGVKEGLGKVSK